MDVQMQSGTRSKGMKPNKMRKVLEAVGIFLFQLLIGWFWAAFLLKADWDIISFVCDPGMIAFWGGYIAIKFLPGFLRRFQKNTGD